MIKKHRILTFVSIFSVLFAFSFLLYFFSQNEDKRFTIYTHELFRQEVSSNALTLHYTLKDSTDFHIYNTPINLGRISTDCDSIGAAAENALASLHKHNRSHLNNENQLIYDLLENTFSSSLTMAPYTLYEEPLAPLTGTQAQLPVLLSEYQFYSEKDIQIYLRLLKNIPDYFHGIIDFETKKSELGLFMSENHADMVIEECQSFINMKNDNYLYNTFHEKIKALNLPAKDYQYYIEQNDFAIRNYIYPAYESLKSHLYKLKNSSVNDKGLYYLPNGKNYYKLLVRNVTGSDRTIPELQMLTLNQITEDLDSLKKTVPLFQKKSSKTFDDTNFLNDSNPITVLNSLKDALAENFPTPPDVNISVKYVTKSMEEYLSPAFYLIPAIDNSNENIIYINPAHISDDLTLFTTLAHEGYPGHLYQTTYFSNKNPSPIRHLLTCGGYTEGWATYCEMLSYYLSPLPKPEATLIQKQSSVMLGLYTLADIGIHYEGWSLKDTIHFFNKYGIYDSESIKEIFNLILGDPANYLKYYIGYIEFLELKKEAIKKWGHEFTQKRFHEEILETGPVPFAILRNQLGTE